ncbi:MAG: 30S ribosomal protein S6 [Chloroflexi bacterium GWC2_73_18]|nr:MAG: 30S ribosomal protein S6 [Chloroflexi bacterium GWC2_73_18]
MRRYELMLVLRADLPDERIQALVDRVTRSLIVAGGQIVKVSPWGRRRLAYPIGNQREGSYHIVVFETAPDAVIELERSLLISEEVLRHLITRVERPARVRRAAVDVVEEEIAPPAEEPEEPVGERIDESESEAAPAAIESD